jgi:REP element-mobilizing transposase RayT
MKKRQSMRLPHYDYSSPGFYFITVCTNHREHLFGDVVRVGNEAQIQLNAIGKIVERELYLSEITRDEMGIGLHVIMPNHVHCIVRINPEHGIGDGDRRICGRRPAMNGRPPDAPTARCRRGRRRRPCGSCRPDASERQLQKRSLGSFMAGFKSAVTSSVRFVIGNANINIWQRNYYERVIRNRKELRKIRRYIKNNPTEWLLDDDNKQ